MKTRARAAAAALPKIAVVTEDERWREDAATLRLMRKALRLGLAAPAPPAPLSHRGKRKQRRAGEGSAVATLLLAGDARLKALNRDFRGKDKPTNVLSFPSADPGYLGDIAIAFETVRREAGAQGKTFARHAAHLALHGALHLVGYDHETGIEAEAMEALETKLLARIGIASPYVLRPLPTGKKAA